MARKRMIDPSFWTDSTIVQLPIEARLLFIGMWNFADDYGSIADDPSQIALQVLPADDTDVEGLVDLLIAAGRVERYLAADGSYFLHIAHFESWQKVDHPAKPTFPTRESSRKLAIPAAVRRAVATKYGCPKGEAVEAQCYYCGATGHIRWWSTSRGADRGWVSFSALELDHFVAEHQGGPTVAQNIVLACRECNRSKGHSEIEAAFSRIVASPRESSQQVNVVEVKLEEVKLREERVVEEKPRAITRRKVALLERSEEEAAALTTLQRIAGFPADQGDETTERLREYADDFADVDLLEVAKELRDKGGKVKNGWLTYRNWLSAKRERNARARAAPEQLVVNGTPIPANSRTARNLRALQDADWPDHETSAVQGTTRGPW